MNMTRTAMTATVQAEPPPAFAAARNAWSAPHIARSQAAKGIVLVVGGRRC